MQIIFHLYHHVDVLKCAIVECDIYPKRPRFTTTCPSAKALHLTPQTRFYLSIVTTVLVNARGHKQFPALDSPTSAQNSLFSFPPLSTMIGGVRPSQASTIDASTHNTSVCSVVLPVEKAVDYIIGKLVIAEDRVELVPLGPTERH